MVVAEQFGGMAFGSTPVTNGTMLSDAKSYAQITLESAPKITNVIARHL